MTREPIHLLLFAKRSARSPCGLKIYAYWPTRRVGRVTPGGQLIACAPAPKLIAITIMTIIGAVVGALVVYFWKQRV